jgi:hypothetical protein
MNIVSFPLATARPQHVHAVSLTSGAERTLVLWHLTSLDAPTVAAVWSLAFAWCSGLHLHPWTPVLLSLTTWCIYVGDRLLDARKGLRFYSESGLRERHFFHWRHRRILLPLAIAAACIALAMVMALLPPIARERGSVMAIAALAYLSGVHLALGSDNFTATQRLTFPNKEFWVGLLFTAGCALPSWPRLHLAGTTQSALWPFWIPVACFAALAWLNCSCIAQWESAEKPPGLLHLHRGANGSAPMHLRLAILLAIFNTGLAASAFPAHPRTAALLACGAASAIILALLDCIRDRLAATTLRAAADLALLTPLVLLWR